MKNLNLSQNKNFSNPMAHEIVLASPEKKYFIGFSPAQVWALYDFLDSAKFNLTYWNESKSYGKSWSFKKFQRFINLFRLWLGFNFLTISHWWIFNQNIIYYLDYVFFYHFKEHRYIMLPKRQEFKNTQRMLLRTPQSSNVKCHETTVNNQIFTLHIKIIVQWNVLMLQTKTMLQVLDLSYLKTV